MGRNGAREEYVGENMKEKKQKVEQRNKSAISKLNLVNKCRKQY